MAFFEQRKNGWRAQVRRRGLPSLSRTFDLKIDAEAWAREIEREHQRGNVAALRQDAQRTTVAQVLEQFPKRTGSNAIYARITERFGAFFLANVRGVDVGAWRDALLLSGLSGQTVIHHLNALSSLFVFAEKDLSIDLPSGNPARKARKPALPRSRDRRLRPGELDALLAAAIAGRSDRVPGMPQAITLAVETSMRLGELLSLEWSRVDLKKRTAHLLDTKNGESRTVALSSAALAALKSLPRRIDGRVFAWQSSQSFERSWKLCLARAQRIYLADCESQAVKPDADFLADLRFHDLRHEATSRLFEKGLGIMEVASMTGHKSLSMLKRYTHIEAEKLAKKLG